MIINNHSSYVNADEKLMETRKTLYFTDLMFEGIKNMKIHKETLGVGQGS